MPPLLAFLQVVATTLSAREATVITVSVIGLVIVTVAQTGAAFYWAGKVQSALDTLGKRQADIIVRLEMVERNGTPLAQSVATALDKEADLVTAVTLRMENHIAAIGTALVRIEQAERRLEALESRCDRLHPPAAVTQRLLP